jgi:1,3-beta-glucan synthase
MSGYPGAGGHTGHHDYDDGYAHPQGQNTDSYYHDEQNQQYYDNHGYDERNHAGAAAGNANEGYYDES